MRLVRHGHGRLVPRLRHQAPFGERLAAGGCIAHAEFGTPAGAHLQCLCKWGTVRTLPQLRRLSSMV
jgi:hypothetical protein